MYLQLTTRCTMHCAHCCFSCTVEGEDMTRATWQEAIDLAVDRGDHISLGGGEPTLHPDFWEILGQCMGQSDEALWLATNGSQTRTAIALAALARRGILGVALSLDDFHDPIDPEVVEAFSDGLHRVRASDDRRPPDLREIRGSGQRLVPQGRARQLVGDKRYKFRPRSECACDGLHVDPGGRIWSCGCMVEQLGTVFDPEIPYDYDSEQCGRRRRRRRAKTCG